MSFTVKQPQIRNRGTTWYRSSPYPDGTSSEDTDTTLSIYTLTNQYKLTNHGGPKFHVNLQETFSSLLSFGIFVGSLPYGIPWSYFDGHSWALTTSLSVRLRYYRCTTTPGRLTTIPTTLRKGHCSLPLSHHLVQDWVQLSTITSSNPVILSYQSSNPNRTTNSGPR